MNFFKKCTANHIFLLIDSAVASDNPLSFRQSLLERMWKPIITIDDKIRNEKLQYNINRDTAKISAIPSGKINKYQYLTGEETWPSSRSQITKKAKFTYSSLRKALENKQRNKSML